ncbi:hypothetical protein GF420_12690 [candidate division GN15 bacterium]|nr:hypothetical protein [candidate division GN15 bacterium]
MSGRVIDADRPVDQLVDEHPDLVKFLIDHDLPCVVCGEPFWGTLRDLASQKGWSDDEIEQLVREFAGKE